MSLTQDPFSTGEVPIPDTWGSTADAWPSYTNSPSNSTNAPVNSSNFSWQQLPSILGAFGGLIRTIGTANQPYTQFPGGGLSVGAQTGASGLLGASGGIGLSTTTLLLIGLAVFALTRK